MSRQESKRSPKIDQTVTRFNNSRKYDRQCTPSRGLQRYREVESTVQGSGDSMPEVSMYHFPLR